MHYYYSGIAGQNFPALQIFKDLKIKTILSSYHTDNKLLFKAFFDDMDSQTSDYLDDAENTRLMIDSGAFTIWNSNGAPVDIEKYAQFCKNLLNGKFKYKKITFINLDVIPARNASQSEILKCIDEGKENYLYLKEQLGAEHILPVIHLGEDLKLIDFYLEHECDYLGIGGLVKAHTGVAEKFVRKIFQRTPEMFKIHGLGYSSKTALYNFPFYSVDSISYKKYDEGYNKWCDIRFWCCNNHNVYFQYRSFIKWLNLEKQITDYWTRKGIVWND